MRAHLTSRTHTRAHKRFELFNVDKIYAFLKKNAVLVIAFCLALVSSFFVPLDSEYLQYFDFKTLTCLFCTLAVVCALKNQRFFYFLAQKTVSIFKNARACVLALTYVTFIGSMLIANDMALITFLPLGFVVLSSTKKEKYMAFTFIMQNVSANLGGMLTPFGNPQNLYLYTKFNIPTLEFMRIMVIPFAVSIALLTLCCFIFVKKENLEFEKEEIKLEPKRTTLYLVLFALSLVIVFRLVHFLIGLVVIFITLLIVDRSALKKVDYSLLFTFVFFFVFAGNTSRIDAVRQVFTYLLDKNTLLFSILSCQVISNVPSAILLSQFTTNYQALLLGVNVGGVGTIISSLASLITFREYLSHNKGKALSYLLKFTAFNLFFLVVLTTLCVFLV